MQQNAHFPSFSSRLFSNRYERPSSVQIVGDTDPEQRVPAALQEQHKVRIHSADAEVEGQDLVQHRVTYIHDDRIHPAPHERTAAPPAFQVDEQEAQR